MSASRSLFVKNRVSVKRPDSMYFGSESVLMRELCAISSLLNCVLSHLIELIDDSLIVRVLWNIVLLRSNVV